MEAEHCMPRVALLTGACGGIGRVIAHGLALDGLRIAVCDLTEDWAFARSLPGGSHAAFAVDVADEESVKNLFKRVEDHLGPISVLVAAAGILLLRPDGSRTPIAETTLDEWDRTQAVNTRGTFLCFREYARRLSDTAKIKRVVSMSSVAAQLGGYRSSASYIASKAAVMGLTKAFAREMADKQVTVNCVAPGLIDAPMLRLSLKSGDEAQASAAIPLGRIGKPEDVASAVRYLVSPEASYLTGITIDVNGGYHMH